MNVTLQGQNFMQIIKDAVIFPLILSPLEFTRFVALINCSLYGLK